ncbi:MAG: hypothetical protein KGS72_11740 [Cyanobacteria bacterium REEB67]|nr:hypothetical protein [Cyanobacteria bacterium REEB67]
MSRQWKTIAKEISREENWFRDYKSVLDREGITKLEIKREAERRKNQLKSPSRELS